MPASHAIKATSSSHGSWTALCGSDSLSPMLRVFSENRGVHRAGEQESWLAGQVNNPKATLSHSVGMGICARKFPSPFFSWIILGGILYTSWKGIAKSGYNFENVPLNWLFLLSYLTSSLPQSYFASSSPTSTTCTKALPQALLSEESK